MTFKQYKLLKLLSRRYMSKSELERHFKNFMKEQEFFDPAFQSFFCRRGDVFHLTVEGMKAFQKKREEDLRFRIPVVISVAALVLSIVSICLQYL